MIPITEFHTMYPKLHHFMEQLLQRPIHPAEHNTARWVIWQLLNKEEWQTLEGAKEQICLRAKNDGVQKWPGLALGFCDPNGPTPQRPTIYRGDFLTTGSEVGGIKTDHTMFLVDENENTREDRLSDAKNRNYNVVSTYVRNIGDFVFRPFDYMKTPQKRNVLISRYSEIRAEGMWPVCWAYPDDSDALVEKPISVLEDELSLLVDTVDGLVAAYVLGLEMNEYWNENEQLQLVKHLANKTELDVFVHFQDRVWNDLPWWNATPNNVHLAYQITASLSDSQFKNELQDRVNVLKSIGRKVVLGESNQLKKPESFSRRRGQIAMQVGCIGSLNGV